MSEETHKHWTKNRRAVYQSTGY